MEQSRARVIDQREARKENHNMGKGLLLWLIGVPIPVIIILWLLFH